MPQSKAEKSIYAAIVRSARSSSCTTTTDPNRSSQIVPLRPVFALCQRDCPPRQRLQPSEAIFAEPALEAKPLFYAPDDTGHVYLLNLRTAAIRHIDLCDPIFKRKEHDITVIKRATWDTLRGGTPKGHPVILVWDRAVIDYRFLQRAKDQAGLYFITRPKSNSNLTRSGLRDIAPTPVNQGVTSDELVAPTSTGRIIRRITWTDPDSGQSWQYLTNEMKLSPGLIVLLYRRRWDLEKVYDQFKNKFHEKKSWASSLAAKTAPAVFLRLVHNLMVCYEATLAKAGIRNVAEEKRRKKELTKRTAKVEKAGRKMPLIISGFQQLTQRTVKFIRWLRRFLWQTRPHDEIQRILKKRYATL